MPESSTSLRSGNVRPGAKPAREQRVQAAERREKITVTDLRHETKLPDVLSEAQSDAGQTLNKSLVYEHGRQHRVLI
jgi:hypothetical protein